MEKSYVILEWVDSAEGEGWTDLDRAFADPPATIQTVAILLRNPTKDNPYYLVCRDLATATDSACGVMRIPKAAVVRMEEFHWPDGFEGGFYDV